MILTNLVGARQVALIGLMAVLAATPVLAEDVSVVGGPGALGGDGAPMEPGQDGSPGEGAIALASSPTDALNIAEATAGAGGDGGRGGNGQNQPAPPFFRVLNGQPGGDGGDGGNAEATAIPGTETSPFRRGGEAIAVGGEGGNGGPAGAPDPNESGMNGHTGNGGLGGGAFAEIVDGPGSQSTNGIAQATGGGGGRGFFAGDGGTGHASVDLSSTASSVNTRAEARGGRGGDGTEEQGSRGGKGGLGLATGRMVVGATNFSTLALDADGGAGGHLPTGAGSVGGAGGDARAEFEIVGSQTTVIGSATGGSGGRATGIGHTGGDGGSAAFSGTSELPVESGSAPRRTVRLTGSGGRGGDGRDGATGGDGGEVDLSTPFVNGEGGSLTISQSAIGGHAGQATSTSGGIGGNGGDATSRVSQSYSGTQLDVDSTASGGNAGSARGINTTARGGDAFASAGGINPLGHVRVEAQATGGGGGDVSGRDGGAAGTSGNAVALATASTVADGSRLTVAADARGGAGGDSDGGQAGVGGAANADATATALGDSIVSSEATATSFLPGRPSTVRADGRDGADTTARASGSNTGRSSVTVTATAAGGAGSDAYGAGQRGGDGGTGTTRASGLSRNGFVNIEARSNGGNGGRGLRLADGGQGGDANAFDSVSGTTENSLRLTQSALGGHGGDGVLGGEGGDATSVLHGRNIQGGNMALYVSAIAGSGGAGRAHRASAGDVHLGVSGEGAQDVTIEASANIGTGSTLILDPIHGRSSGAGNVFVRLEVRGQADRTRGGNQDSGDGVDVMLDNAVSGETDGGVLTLWQRAIAGQAVDTNPGIPGNGGNGESRMSGITRDTTVVNADAYGGSGGDEPRHVLAPDNVPAGRGGDASTDVDYATEDGDLILHAGARGGRGGDSFRLRPGGNGGNARVRAEVRVDSSATNGARIGGAEPRRFGDAQVGAYGGDGMVTGNGGDADSESRMTSFASANTERHQVIDRAFGGDGGDRGGLGGDARSFAHLSAAGDEDLLVSSEATSGAGALGGQAEARAHGESLTGDVSATAIQTIGDTVASDMLEGGPRAGHDAEMSNAASGATRGRLTLTQTSVAGAGSSRSTAPGDGGRGGFASSVLTEGNAGGRLLTAELSSTGGAGGRAFGAGSRAGDGGDAISRVDLRDVTQSVSLVLEATGGAGGLSADGGSPGQGGAAGFGNSVITADSNQFLGVEATARSGDGGSRDPFQDTRSRVGGHAQNVDLENAIEVETLGTAWIEQRAIGGDGGNGRGTGGNGGDARSVLRRLNSNSSSERLRVYAEGGAAGESAEDRAGAAGTAHAEIEAHSAAGSLTLKGESFGGTNGLSGISGPRDRAGDASVAIVGTVESDGGRLNIGRFNSIDNDYGATGGDGLDITSSIFNSDHLETVGDGGHATSRSEGTALGNGVVSIRDRAVGGEGGRVSSRTGVAAGVGGDASSAAVGRGEGGGSLQVTAEAIGGIGGSFGNSRAMGGTARAVASGVSTDGGEVTVSALQTGGTLQDSEMIDQVSGSTSGSLELIQVSTGGHGGAAARSELTASNPGGGSLTARSEAIGGRGDRTRDQAGAATARLVGIDVNGAPLDVTAIALGGDAFQQGPGAAATAHAAAEGRGRVIAAAQSTGGRPRGSSTVDGASQAHASAIGVLLASARSEMTRGGQHDGEASATLRPTLGDVTEASAILRTIGASQSGVGMKSDVFVRGIDPGPPSSGLSIDAQIQVAIAETPDSTGQLADIDIVLASKSGASGWSQEAVVELAVATELPMALVFDDWTGTGAGIEAFAVKISYGNETLVDQVFSDVVLALAFLSGAEIEFDGDGSAGSIRASFQLVSGASGDGLMGGFALVVIPEPSTALLLLGGLVGLNAKRRRQGERSIS